MDLKKKQENQVQLLKQKQKSDEAAKRLQDEIQFIKQQKVFKSIVCCFFFSKIFVFFSKYIVYLFVHPMCS